MLVLGDSDLVILHMPKCAGTTIKHAIKDNFRWYCAHAPISILPQEYVKFKRVGFYRDPVEWYVSKYYFCKRHSDIFFIVPVLSDNFKLNFKQTFPRLLNLRRFLQEHPEYIDRIKDKIRTLLFGNHLSFIPFAFTNIENINADTFGENLYNYWYKLVGLHTATLHNVHDINNILSTKFKVKGTVRMNIRPEPTIIENEYTPELLELCLMHQHPVM